MRVSISLLVLLAAQLPAQYLAGVVGPAPEFWGGATVELTVSGTAASPGVEVPGQLVTSIHHGSPGGPLVAMVPASGGPPLQIGPLDSQTQSLTTWTVPTVSAPTLYYLRVDWSVPATGEAGAEWYPVSVSPTLHLWVPSGQAATQTSLPIGETTVFWFSGPGCSGFPYFAAVSSSTNVGLPVPGASHMVLDVGTPLWELSWPNPHPALFGAFQGQMSVFGAGLCTITLPNLPQLVGMPVVLQVAAVGGGGSGPPLWTNPLSMVVTP